MHAAASFYFQDVILWDAFGVIRCLLNEVLIDSIPCKKL